MSGWCEVPEPGPAQGSVLRPCNQLRQTLRGHAEECVARLLPGTRGPPRARPGVGPRGSTRAPGEHSTALALVSGRLPAAAQHPRPCRARLPTAPPGALPGDCVAVEKSLGPAPPCWPTAQPRVLAPSLPTVESPSFPVGRGHVHVAPGWPGVVTDCTSPTNTETVPQEEANHFFFDYGKRLREKNEQKQKDRSPPKAHLRRPPTAATPGGLLGDGGWPRPALRLRSRPAPRPALRLLSQVPPQLGAGPTLLSPRSSSLGERAGG